MAKQKFYVVWKGRQTGVFDTWDECSKHTSGFQGAVFKAFPSRVLAEQAFNADSKEFIGKNTTPLSVVSDERKQIIGNPILDSISVDGAWNTMTGVVEYKGVHTKTGEVIFAMGPYEDGTNNIVEFLGIVHALAYCKKQNIEIPIYSDSKTAISWVKKKNANTKHQRSDKNEKLFIMLERAVQWLKENEYTNSLLKWETDVWGENPADFGRK